jgi:hypothetical protein
VLLVKHHYSKSSPTYIDPCFVSPISKCTLSYTLLTAIFKIQWIIQLLDSLNESQLSRRSESPYPDNESLFFYVLNYLLIYLDLADPAIALPPFPEGALADDDNMMVDDDCK